MSGLKGAGVLVDMACCKALNPNCSKGRLCTFTLLCILWHWCRTSDLNPTTYFNLYSFIFLINLIQFCLLHSGLWHSTELSGESLTVSLSVLSGESSVSTWFFPVSCLLRRGTENRTSCQKKAAAAGPQRFLQKTPLILQLHRNPLN